MRVKRSQVKLKINSYSVNKWIECWMMLRFAIVTVSSAMNNMKIWYYISFFPALVNMRLVIPFYYFYFFFFFFCIFFIVPAYIQYIICILFISFHIYQLALIFRVRIFYRVLYIMEKTRGSNNNNANIPYFIPKCFEGTAADLNTYAKKKGIIEREKMKEKLLWIIAN